LYRIVYFCLQEPRDISDDTNQEKHSKPVGSSDMDKDSITDKRPVLNEEVLATQSTSSVESRSDLSSRPIPPSPSSASDAMKSVVGADVPIGAEGISESSDQSDESVADESRDDDQSVTEIHSTAAAAGPHPTIASDAETDRCVYY